MQITGTIKQIGVETQVSASFKNQKLVITTDEQYPQHIEIEFTQDKCEYLDGYQVGQSVKVSINLGGRIWVNPQGEEKYFNSIKGWRIEKVGEVQQHAGEQFTNPAFEPKPQEAKPTPTAKFTPEEEDGLPF